MGEQIAGLFGVAVSVAVASAADLRSAQPSDGWSLDPDWTPKRRRQYVAGRRAAGRALVGIGVEPGRLSRLASGAPAWPPGTIGSIAHCDLLCCAVAASATVADGIGIDAEERRAIGDPLARSILIPQERDLRRRLPPELANMWPLIAFSAKEALFKAHHPIAGTWIELEDVAVEPGMDADLPLGSFTIRFMRPNLPLAERARDFRGRYLVTDSLVITGVTLLPRRNRGREAAPI